MVKESNVAQQVARFRSPFCRSFKGCWANNLDSYCARVGSGVQTDTTTPYKLACEVHWGKDTTHNTLETIYIMRVASTMFDELCK